MKQYIEIVSNPKKRITMQNFKSLIDYKLIPKELKFQKQVFNFDKTMKNNANIQQKNLI